MNPARCTARDPFPNPPSQGYPQTVNIKPVAVDTNGTEVRVEAFGQMISILVKTTGA